MTAIFRVWCLSWDETEEDGRDVVAAIGLLATSQSRRGPLEIYGLTGAEDAAEAYAAYAHDHEDGCESTWPLLFRVRCPDGTVRDFEVCRDFDPTFRAAPVREECRP